MDRSELRDDPRLYLESKLEANGFTSREALKMISEMNDEEVKAKLKSYL